MAAQLLQLRYNHVMNFLTLNENDGLKQHLAQRLNQLENEYLSNQSGIVVLEFATNVDTEEVARLNSNLVEIESVHAATLARIQELSETTVEEIPSK